MGAVYSALYVRAWGHRQLLGTFLHEMRTSAKTLNHLVFSAMATPLPMFRFLRGKEKTERRSAGFLVVCSVCLSPPCIIPNISRKFSWNTMITPFCQIVPRYLIDMVLPTGNSDSHRVFANVLAMDHGVRVPKEGVQDRLVHPENRPRAGAPFGGVLSGGALRCQ